MKHHVQQGKKFFCTECGSDLDDFWVSPNADAYADILKHHMECQRSGKFKGAMCSKLFIADGTTPARTGDSSKLSRKRVAHLKKSIIRKIADEEGKQA